MTKCDVDISSVEYLSDSLKRWVSIPLSFTNQKLIEEKNSAQDSAKTVIKEAQEKIALIEAENTALAAGLLAAQAADLISIAAGEPANAVREIEFKITANKARIERIHLAIQGILSNVLDRIESAMETYIDTAERLESEYKYRFTEVINVLDDYIGNMNAGKSELSEEHLSKTATSTESSNLYTSDSLTLADDIGAIVNSGEGLLSEIALSGNDYASTIARETGAKEIDAFKTELGSSLGHRHPIGFGEWTDSQGHVVSPSASIDKGIFYWTPDRTHVFGGKRSNPLGLTAGEITQKYGFQSFTYKDGYPIFPESSVLASVSLVGVLSAERPKNFEEAAILLIKTNGQGQKPEFCRMVSDFMLVYPDSGDWFNSKVQVEKFRKLHRLTWHESEDMRDIQLIPRELHSMALHDGGVSNAAYRDRLEAEFRLLAQAALDDMLSEN